MQFKCLISNYDDVGRPGDALTGLVHCSIASKQPVCFVYASCIYIYANCILKLLYYIQHKFIALRRQYDYQNVRFQ